MTNTRKCNNNIILAVDNGQEVIALGKGIGFNSRPGDEVDMRLVEKVFVPQETAHFNRFKDILADLPYEYIMLADTIVAYAKKELRQPLNQSVIIALADHLHYVHARFKEQLDIHVPLAWDIQHIYPAEFAFGKKALRMVNRKLDVTFPDAEATAIALHVINAESEYADMPNTVTISLIIQKTIEIIESRYKFSLNTSTPDFNGFVTLLRGTIIRFLYHPDEKQADEDKELYELLRKRYAFECGCAEQIALFIETDYQWRFSRNDVSFLTLYISRITAGGGS